MSLTLTEIAVRSAAFWFGGLFGYFVLSIAAINQHYERSTTFWTTILTIVSYGAMLIGVAGVGLLIARWASHYGENLALVLAGVGIVVSFWLTRIICWLAFNKASELKGGKAKPIPWPFKRKHSRKLR